MKQPKLKYYYIAMAAGNYQDFAQSRSITISPQATIDLETGRVTGQTLVYIAATANLADDNYRDLYKTAEDLYVLRIPRECIDRHQLISTAREGIWEYRRSILVPHCGVEKFAVDVSQNTSNMATIAI